MEPADSSSLERQFPDEWLLIDVTDIDEFGRPTQSLLVAHSPSREALDDYWRTHEVQLPAIVWSGSKPRTGFVSVLSSSSEEV